MERPMFCYIPLLLLLFDVTHAKIVLTHSKEVQIVDENFMVTCKDEAGQMVAWSGPRGKLGTKTHPRVEVSSFGTSLVFMPIKKDDGGSYRCSMGKEHALFNLTVDAPLTFMDTAPVQKGKEGSNITLRCEVKGGIKPIITWSGENLQLREPKFTIIADGLAITNATRADARVYTCRAMKESAGIIREQKITLKIEHKPYPKHPPLWAKQEEAWGFLGGIVNLTCEVEAEPPPRFEWLRKNRKLQLVDGAIHNEPHRSILQLFVNNTSVFGDYKCKVSNPLGTLEKVFSLQQGTQPPPPSTVELHEVGADLVDLRMQAPLLPDAPQGMEPTGFRVQYRTSEEQTKWEHANAVDFPTREDNTYVVTELEPNTNYFLRVATKNRAGLSDFFPEIAFKTLRSGSVIATLSPLALAILLMIAYL